MTRIFILAAIPCLLSACSMSLPSFSAFDDDKSLSKPAPKVSGQGQQSASGKNLSGFWDSVSSPFSKNSNTRNAALTAANFDPSEAQTLINTYRTRKGLPALKLNPKLSAAAKMHSEDLAKRDRISHFGSDGSDIEERARRAGYSFRLIAENIGTGQLSAAEVVDGWQKSPSHNANLLLPDAQHMGIAMVYRKDTEFQTFWTLVIGNGQ